MLRAALDHRSATASQQARLQIGARHMRDAGRDPRAVRAEAPVIPLDIGASRPGRRSRRVGAGRRHPATGQGSCWRDFASPSPAARPGDRHGSSPANPHTTPSRTRCGSDRPGWRQGKTTLAAGLDKSLLVPARIVYMGVWRTPRAIAFFGAPGRVGHAIAIQWLRWFQGAYHRSRGRFVIFDRYTEVHLEPAPRRDRRGTFAATSEGVGGPSSSGPRHDPRCSRDNRIRPQA